MYLSVCARRCVCAYVCVCVFPCVREPLLRVQACAVQTSPCKDTEELPGVSDGERGSILACLKTFRKTEAAAALHLVVEVQRVHKEK